MIQRRWASLLACLTLLFAVPGGASSSAWYCEGQRCGVTLWRCCCNDPAPYQDGKCRQPSTHQSGADTAAGCSTGCNCVLVMTAAPGGDRTVPPSVAAPDPPTLLAVLPAPPVDFCLLLPDLATVYPSETRGPPPGRTSVSTPSLRAPPIA